jgi:hypothetical protein
MTAPEPHKNEPDTYSIRLYDRLGRKRGIRLRHNLMASQALADRWSRLTGGSATVHRCLYNTALSRGKWRAK